MGEEIVGTDRARPRNQWFDEDCERAKKMNGKDGKKYSLEKMQVRKTRVSIEEYQNKRRRKWMSEE